MPAHAATPLAGLVPSGNPDITLFIVVMALGFLVGIGGHVYRSTPLIIAGIALVFAGTFVLPLIVFGTGR